MAQQTIWACQKGGYDTPSLIRHDYWYVCPFATIYEDWSPDPQQTPKSSLQFSESLLYHRLQYLQTVLSADQAV